ncbi:MAG TPA: substrate-binding domain-containing protein [Planctomycetota bacterium]|nr:substrate-binding domain-containing protein [Planctomycetota bacterium]
MLRVLMVPLCAAAMAIGCSSDKDSKAAPPAANPKVVRAAVIGGMTMTGLWPELSRMFEAETGYKVEVAVTGPRPILAKAFKEGQADLLTMHSGDITTDLVADGFGTNMRPWTRNDLVVVGPRSDPAGIRGLADGAEAFRCIAQAKANFVDFEGIGSREVCHKLWKMAGVQREGPWVLKDESGGHAAVLDFARRENAYVVVGLMPVLYEKLSAEGMEVLVQGDPAMQRPYVVMEANPAKLPGVNAAGAKALADFLLSEKVQTFLAGFGRNSGAAGPLFHPLTTQPAR